MICLGLTGYPLDHSLSPRLHAAAFTACGREGEYALFPVHPGNRQALGDLLSRIRKGELAGLNVTIPHKQTVIEFLDGLTPTAQSIGAVNTVYLQEGRLIGDNTDAPGFFSDLKKLLTRAPQGPGPKALVFGAGGSARAVVYALLKDGWHITLAARRIEQAGQLAACFPGVETTSPNLRSLQPADLQLIVNTTPLGMSPDTDRSPWPDGIPFPPRAAIYDLVYNPRQTKLVRDASRQGLPAATGLGMLVEQAALSFEIWTGCTPPRQAMIDALGETTDR